MKNNKALDELILKIEKNKKKLIKTPSLSSIKKFNYLRKIFIKTFPEMKEICWREISVKTYKEKNKTTNIDVLTGLYTIKNLIGTVK